MLTTASKSENSNRCGVSASRSLGPMSGSASISEKILSITSRSSLADSNEALMAQEPPAAGFGAAGLTSGAAAGFAGAGAGGGFGGRGGGGRGLAGRRRFDGRRRLLRRGRFLRRARFLGRGALARG